MRVFGSEARFKLRTAVLFRLWPMMPMCAMRMTDDIRRVQGQRGAVAGGVSGILLYAQKS